MLHSRKIQSRASETTSLAAANENPNASGRAGEAAEREKLSDGNESDDQLVEQPELEPANDNSFAEDIPATGTNTANQRPSKARSARFCSYDIRELHHIQYPCAPCNPDRAIQPFGGSTAEPGGPDRQRFQQV